MIKNNNLVLSEKAKEMMRVLKFNSKQWELAKKDAENEEEMETIDEIIDYLKEWVKFNKENPYSYNPKIERYINNKENDYFKYVMISLLMLFLFVWLMSR